jgi:putative acyl-CoA dehydrogenase
MIGEDGRGIREFVKHMTHGIRLDLCVGSAGIMRRALTLAFHHTRGRDAFGSRIADLPQTANALADLALESEAAMLLAMRCVSATEKEKTSEHDARLLRIGVPLAKYWICKRTNHVVLEALESHGGMGFIEEQPIARLLREAPLNSIWEGTAAIMGLDFIRAVRKEPGSLEALMTEIRLGVSADRRFSEYVAGLEAELVRADVDLEANARRLMGKTALALQASLMSQHAPAEIADLFIASRLSPDSPGELGMLPAAAPLFTRIAQRALASS